ncbi:MAG: hypothetical protein L6416_09000 [Candidatus Omnitrophica bacterium]|nr:hypothetical protein [Candidatus Omnitrophota bacterium]
MKEKYENLEKVIFFVLLCLVLGVIPVLFNKAAANNDILDKKIQRLSTRSTQSAAGSRDYTKTEEYLNIEEQTVRALSSVTSKRNIFSEHGYNKSVDIAAGDRRVLQVIEIGFKPLGIEYQGKVFFKDDNEMLAQVNMYKKSYLVKEGSHFAYYQVHELNEKFIKLKDKKGKVIEIKYRQKAYVNERVAKINELTRGYSETVTKNSNFLEYKVLDIDEDSVLLSHQGQHLRLEKGMVYK